MTYCRLKGLSQELLKEEEVAMEAEAGRERLCPENFDGTNVE